MKFGKDTNTSRPDLQKVNKPKTLHGKMSIMKEGGNTMASKMNPGFMAMMAKKKGMSTAKDGMKRPTPMADTSMMGMKKGGMAKGCATKSDAKMIAKKEVKGHESSMHKMKMGGKCMAAGGKASQLAKANGIAVRGKTKGKIC